MQHSDPALPKPLVDVGGRPILWHVMSLYAAQGRRRFVLLLGNGAEHLRAFAATLPPELEVTCLDTGVDTPTGGRVLAAADRLDGATFHLTYADGVADIDLAALEGFHFGHDAAATVTVVRPVSQWGMVHLDGDGRVDRFEEKPRLESWVNGGFFLMESRAIEFIAPGEALERRPLEALAAAGELRAFRHDGFWDCMDTYKDTLLLNELWERGEAPWRAMVGV